MFRLCRFALVVCSLAANFEFSEFFGEQCALFGRSWWLLSREALWSNFIANSQRNCAWAAGKTPEKLAACSQECLGVKIKNNFSEPEKLFF